MDAILDDLGPNVEERNPASVSNASSIKPSTAQGPLIDKLQSLQLQQEERKLKLRHFDIETAVQRRQIELEIQEIAIEIKLEERRRARMDSVSHVGANAANSGKSYSACRSPFVGYEQEAERVLNPPTLDILRQMQLPRMSILNFDGNIRYAIWKFYQAIRICSGEQDQK